MYPHQIESKTVNVIFFRPEFDRLNDIMANHFAFWGCLISTPGSIWIGTVGILAVKISRNRQVKIRMLGWGCMVINHIEYNTKTILMEAFYHLFKFADTGGGGDRIGRVTSIWYIIILRVISPIVFVFLQFPFIDCGEIEWRKDVYMRYSQFF